MKESYGEGVASHTGPESCVVARKGGGEALTGERAGRVLSREIHALSQSTLRGADAVEKAEGNTGASLSRDAPGPRAVGDPEHARKHLAREPGDPTSACGEGAAGRTGKSKDASR